MESHIVYGAAVPGKFIEKLARPRFPNGYALISAASRNPLALGIPACFEEVAFLACWRSIKGEDSAVSWCKWSDVPCPNSRIVCV
jgi:hypothetical protein